MDEIVLYIWQSVWRRVNRKDDINNVRVFVRGTMCT